MQKLFISATIVASSLWLTGCGKPNTDQGAAGRSADESARGQSSSYDRAGTNAEQRARDVDNSAVNQRDRNEEALTPGDQGNSPQDRELTRRIRRSVTQNDQLSTTAKNIKIITADGKVTLRGPVKTEAERNLVAAIAQQAAGSGSIDNQLEVKQTTETTEERK